MLSRHLFRSSDGHHNHGRCRVRPNPATAGSPVTLTATVTGTSPTGTVSLADNGSPARRLHRPCADWQRQHPYRHLHHQQPRRRHPQPGRLITAAMLATPPSNSTALAQVVNSVAATGHCELRRHGRDDAGQLEGRSTAATATPSSVTAPITQRMPKSRPAGETAYVWAAQTTDPRALQRGVARRTNRCHVVWLHGFTVV